LGVNPHGATAKFAGGGCAKEELIVGEGVEDLGVAERDVLAHP